MGDVMTTGQRRLKKFIKYLHTVKREDFDIEDVSKCVMGHIRRDKRIRVRTYQYFQLSGSQESWYRRLVNGRWSGDKYIYPRKTPKGCANWLEKYCVENKGGK